MDSLAAHRRGEERREGGDGVSCRADRMKSRLSSHDNENALAPLCTTEQTGMGGFTAGERTQSKSVKLMGHKNGGEGGALARPSV